MDLLDLVVFNNRIRTWLVALLVGVATAVTIQLIKRLLLHRLKPLTQRTSTRLDDGAMLAIEKTNSFIVTLLSIYAGILVLKVPLAVMEWISAVAFIVLLLQVGIWGDMLV